MDNSKLPYKVKFDSDYEEYHQRIAMLPVPPISATSEPKFQVSDELLQLVEQVKDKIKDEDLEFEPSNIYSQYASAIALKDGKKNASDNCPNCGEDSKKQVQCEFCAVMYCKNCCWRKRVLPHISDPKDSRLQCQDCHFKFVKLFANQHFYQEVATFNRIIESSNSRLRKLEKETKTKRDRFELAEKKKKEVKIKEGFILKQIKDEEKKVQQLQSKLAEIVSAKADKIRKQEQRKEEERKRQIQNDFKIQKQKQQQESAKKRLEQEEAQKKRRQQEAEQQMKKLAQILAQKVVIQSKTEQTAKQIQEHAQQSEIQKLKEMEKQRVRKIQQQRIAQQRKREEEELLKKKISEEEHKRQTNELLVLGKQMIKQNDTDILKTAEKSKTSQTPNSPKVLISENNSDQVTKSPNVEGQSFSSLVASKGKDGLRDSIGGDSSPLRVLSSFNVTPQDEKHKQPSGVKESIGNSEKSQKWKEKTELTESTEKAEQMERNSKQNLQNQLPPVAINVTEMTVNQLLGIHVNPYNNLQMNRRSSSYREQSKEERPSSLTMKTPEKEEPEVVEISNEQKLEIFRSSNMSSSLLHSKQEQVMYEHPDPAGGKCNCSLM